MRMMAAGLALSLGTLAAPPAAVAVAAVIGSAGAAAARAAPPGVGTAVIGSAGEAAARVAPPGVGTAGVVACRTPPQPAAPIRELPWAQRWFAPTEVWRLSRGSGIVVAVVDSGVDTRHPQLDGGQVRSGADLTGTGNGTEDCDGHGTAVASIIAAEDVPDIGFAGLAPGAQILPVRVADRNTDPPDADAVGPAAFAAAITWAADHGARVINASIVFNRPHQSIEDAVRYAQDRGAIVVAAVGNGHTDSGPDPTPYPAAYPGVVGVGAIAATGTRVPASYVGPYVDIVAPGGDVTAANPVGGHQPRTGTSFAAPFVSATLALLLAAEPNLTPAAAVRRLAATADPAAGSAQEYGDGVVNPYRALTERVTTQAPVTAAPIADRAIDPAARLRVERERRSRVLALAIAGGVAAVGIVVVFLAAVWIRGRRNAWAPVRSGEPVVESTVDQVDDPAETFYTAPAP